MFTYNILQLLESVKNRPCLWDKSDDGYNDRTKRKAAWDEICLTLEPNYQELSEEMQKNVATAITCKWANVRDTFIKAIKAKGRKKKRKYIYHDHLTFLFKVTPQTQEEYDNSDDEPDTWGYMKEEDSGENLASYLQSRSFRNEESQSTSSTEPERRRKLPQYEEYEPIEVEVDTQIEEVDDPLRVMNEDEAFFASLLPTVVRYDEDERLEFRMEVLAVMKKIKEKRRWVYVETVNT